MLIMVPQQSSLSRTEKRVIPSTDDFPLLDLLLFPNEFSHCIMPDNPLCDPHSLPLCFAQRKVNNNNKKASSVLTLLCMRGGALVKPSVGFSPVEKK